MAVAVGVCVCGWRGIAKALVTAPTNRLRISSAAAAAAAAFSRLLCFPSVFCLDTGTTAVQKYLFFKKHIGKMDTLFGNKFERVDDAGKPFSRCGTCGMYMKLIEQRPRRLYCGTCEVRSSLPHASLVSPRIAGGA